MSATPLTIRKRMNRAIREIEEAERQLVAFTGRTRDGQPDLVGVAEAAAILGISANAISTRRTRGRFPEPLVTLSCGPIWRQEDIEALRK
jgi:hypothetical protein